MQLLQAQELVIVFHFIAYAKLIVTVLNMHYYEVHELSEDLLRGDTLLLAVSYKSHHKIQSKLILNLHFQILWFEFQQYDLFPIVFKEYPAEIHEWHKY